MRLSINLVLEIANTNNLTEPRTLWLFGDFLASCRGSRFGKHRR